MPASPDIRFLDKHTQKDLGLDMAWVAVSDDQAVCVLTAYLKEPRDVGDEIIPRRAQVAMICTHPEWRGKGLASAVVRRALSDLKAQGLRLYRTGIATEEGRKVFENLGVSIDPVAVWRYKKYLDALAVWGGKGEYKGMNSPYEPYSDEAAAKNCYKTLREANALLGFA